ncbi:carboxynorspermidine decarboxylase [bacterium]|nr:carboxynorspermidine decarboxylase [bacterium]
MTKYTNVHKTPCYVLDTGLLTKNLEILQAVQEKTGCEILLALKAFSMFSAFSLISKYLKGTCASTLYEARLGAEEFGKEVHIFNPAYKKEEFEDVLKYSSHIVFNSFNQWEMYKDKLLNSNKNISAGLRINPEHSEVKVALYDPCAPGSRLGIKAEDFEGKDLSCISGLHFHNLCELNSDSLERTLKVFEKKFDKYIKQMQWINFGGGHHITRDDYDVDRLCRLVLDFSKKYDVKIYLEPGEAVVLNTGFLVSTVLDFVHNDIDIALLDTSAAAHMPDVLEMPYRPGIIGAGQKDEFEFNYRLAGPTCLAGDVIGDYSFKEKLKIGDRLVFTDMAHYTMVKNNTFNGVSLPLIVIYDSVKDEFVIVRKFGYEDFKNRL